jgi:hypothetical protein
MDVVVTDDRICAVIDEAVNARHAAGLRTAPIARTSKGSRL